MSQVCRSNKSKISVAYDNIYFLLTLHVSDRGLEVEVLYLHILTLGSTIQPFDGHAILLQKKTAKELAAIVMLLKTSAWTWHLIPPVISNPNPGMRRCTCCERCHCKFHPIGGMDNPVTVKRVNC